MKSSRELKISNSFHCSCPSWFSAWSSSALSPTACIKVGWATVSGAESEEDTEVASGETLSDIAPLKASASTGAGIRASVTISGESKRSF